MLRLAATAALLLATTLPAAAQDIGGSYSVSGVGHNGQAYSGTAEITLTSDTTCEIVWVTGPSTSDGICMRNGIAFAAGYVLEDQVGLAIYEVLQDGTLDGIWTLAGVPGNGTETLTPLR